ncbi:MAG: sulfoxide reductase heme-binding subunit YedZ [Proteobacteria bacterium]|nr:sulfoxide reductase heme-binding subunit YedZ [Pseudomonadota bacterium]
MQAWTLKSFSEQVLRMRLGKPLVFAACLVPLVCYGYWFFTDSLGANPIEAITRRAGDWALRFLLITLVISPLRKLTGWHGLARYRRMLGLFAFFYVCVHLSLYVTLDKFFDLAEIIEDVIDRPFITVGFIAFVLLIPLAATSTNRMVDVLQHRWTQLHRLVYVVAMLAVLHFWWMVKIDTREPAIYAAVLTGLLGFRLTFYLKRKLQETG